MCLFFLLDCYSATSTPTSECATTSHFAHGSTRSLTAHRSSCRPTSECSPCAGNSNCIHFRDGDEQDEAHGERPCCRHSHSRVYHEVLYEENTHPCSCPQERG